MTRDRGFTLVELLVALALSSIIVATAYSALHAASQVVAITERLALGNAMLRGALLRSYDIADRRDPEVVPPQTVALGMPLDEAEWSQVPESWPLVRLRVEAVDDHRAPMLWIQRPMWLDGIIHHATVGAPYGWVDLAPRQAPNDREHYQAVVQPGYPKHSFRLSMSDPVSGDTMALEYEVAGATP